MILERVAKGEELALISRDISVTPTTVSAMLVDDPEYQAAREVGAEARLAMREKKLEEADTMVAVTRDSALLRHQAWRCEREFPKRWGKEPGAKSSITVVVSRMGYRNKGKEEVVIEHDAGDVPHLPDNSRV